MNFNDIDSNLTSPAFFAGENYHSTFSILRKEDPVHWTKGNHEKGYWSITRYTDCVQVLENAALFSSGEGSHLPPTAVPLTERQRYDMGYGSIPTHTDPPRHMTFRRPFNRHFSVPAIQKLRQQCDIAADAILGSVGNRGECELVEDIAAQLPVAMVLQMMGIPKQDWSMVRHHCTTFMSSQDPEFQIEGDASKTKAQAQRAVFEYVTQLALDRRRAPTDDFTSLIGTMEIDGQLMSERDVGWWCFSLVAAGLESTRNALALGLLEFMRRPDQAQKWRDDPTLGASAVEEVLRWVTPSKHKLRVATEDTELGSKRIKKGDWLVVWLVSANRDEAVFERPNEFDIERSPNRHLSFGVGEHVCIGRYLARLEMELLMNKVLRLMPDMKQNGGIEYLSSDNSTGLKRLPVRFTPFATEAA